MHETNLGILVPLDQESLKNINGGNGVLGSLLKKTLWGAIIYSVAENWGTIKEAVKDGWNGEYGCESCK